MVWPHVSLERIARCVATPPSWLAALTVVGCANGTVGAPIVVNADGGEPQDAQPVVPADAGQATDATASDGASPNPGICADWASPQVKASCTDSCNTHTCGPNGCYGSWWCEISTRTCKKAPPSGCN